MAAKIPLVIDKGATFRYQFIWKTQLKRSVDLTGYIARMQVRSSVESETVLTTLTTESGGIVLGGVDGKISLYLSHTATSQIAWTKGVYDIELISPTGEVTRLAEGLITATPEVTR